MISSGQKLLELTGIDNTECVFSIELYSDAALLTPADSAIFTLLNPVFKSGSVDKPAKIFIETTDTAYSMVSVDLYVKVNSDKNAIDHDETSFKIIVSFSESYCIKNLSQSSYLSTLWSTNYPYKIGDPDITINFNGVLNGDCRFSALLIDLANPSTLPVWMTFVEPTFNLASAPDSYAVSTETSLTISTSILTDKGTFSFRLEFTDEWSPETSYFEFTIQLFNNPCIKGFRNVPSDS